MANARVLVAVLALLAASSAAAQNLRVVAVPWVDTDPSIPHLAYNGHATTFKAIARGGNGTYVVEWDFQGDGVYDLGSSTTNRYNLSARFTYPNQAATTTFWARVRVTSNGQTVMATYPVRVEADVPSNPSLATARQLQVMRNVAIDDGLWYLHNQLIRSGNEEDPLLGAQLQGYVSASYSTIGSAEFLEALCMNGHAPAFPAAYLGAMPDAAANTARWNNDPYAEDAARLVNFLLARASVVSVSAADEANLVGFYPEVTSTPIAGSDDGIGLWIGAAPGDLTTGPHSNALRGLARAHLAGYVAQVGDSSRVLGRPIELIIQQLVDALVWAQSETGQPGSWYYTPNSTADMLGEYAGGVLDAEEALLVAERNMGDAGVIVPNLAKARLAAYILQSQNACATGGIGGSYVAASTVCDFALSAANLVTWGWLGANQHPATDTRIAFPSHNGYTFGQLRTAYDGVLTFIGNTFNSTAPGLNNWDIGFVPGGDFSRVDGTGDLWSMLHWSRAARSVEPPIASFGINDHARLFSGYLIRNQASTGGWSWVFSTMNNHNDNIVGAEVRAAWAIITLSGEDGVAPVAFASASVTTASEGTTIDFTGESNVAGAATYQWSFGNGQTGEGKQNRLRLPGQRELQRAAPRHHVRRDVGLHPPRHHHQRRPGPLSRPRPRHRRGGSGFLLRELRGPGQRGHLDLLLELRRRADRLHGRGLQHLRRPGRLQRVLPRHRRRRRDRHRLRHHHRAQRGPPHPLDAADQRRRGFRVLLPAGLRRSGRPGHPHLHGAGQAGQRDAHRLHAPVDPGGRRAGRAGPHHPVRHRRRRGPHLPAVRGYRDRARRRRRRPA
ncbi:MAG: hypothetical protein QM767_16335 [Anaeromyxobacter sp.]